MKKLAYKFMIIFVFLLQTCAISFKGNQNISYVNDKPILSNNAYSDFESINVKTYRRDNSEWLSNDHVAKEIIESHS